MMEYERVCILRVQWKPLQYCWMVEYARSWRVMTELKLSYFFCFLHLTVSGHTENFHLSDIKRNTIVMVMPMGFSRILQDSSKIIKRGTIWDVWKLSVNFLIQVVKEKKKNIFLQVWCIVYCTRIIQSFKTLTSSVLALSWSRFFPNNAPKFHRIPLDFKKQKSK